MTLFYRMKLCLLMMLSLCCCELNAQQGYAVNAETADFPIKKIINYSSTTATFGQFKNRLLILDFFGTWCVPCVKALPHLTALQETYKDQINIVLVSEEAQDKLENFIKKRSPFNFPVVVDEEKKFINLFQPPSYPYTVIIGKNNKVIAIPSQEEITDENIKKWLTEQDLTLPGTTNTNQLVNDSVNTLLKKKSITSDQSPNKLVSLSQDFIYAAKTGDETTGFINRFQQLSFDELKTALPSDDEKKAFWINLYNAYTQVALKKNPDQYKKRGQFFGAKQIAIAGKTFSLDDIEHGILRRSKIKWSLGYLNKLFPGKTEKSLRVNKLDYRLHFALNCGAKSCPPIAFYKSATINEQLTLATKAYLKSEVTYDEKKNTVTLPALMNWFRRDFGGKKKMITLLKELSIIPSEKNPKINFSSYDWTLYLQNYKS